MEKVNEISPLVNGIYNVQTQSGSHYKIVINNLKMSLVRRPANEESALRKDGQGIKILELIQVEVGYGGRLLLAPLGEGENTLRLTTEVVAIMRANLEN